MAPEHVLDDGESETDPAVLPGPATIHAEKTLCKARNVLFGNALARIGHDEVRAVRTGPPRECYFAVRGRVADRVRQEIGDHGINFAGIAAQLSRGLHLDANVRNTRLSCKSFAGAGKQRGYIDRFLNAGVSRPLETGKLEQLGDDMRHTLRLLSHSLHRLSPG